VPERARIEPWGASDLPLLQALLADPAMMGHLGGPESAGRIARRQAEYEQPGSRQFKVVDAETGVGAGWVGYWERDWRGRRVFEIGWSVVPAFQGRGLAKAGTAAVIAVARADEAGIGSLHAFPSVDNRPSNGICRSLGFELLGPCEFEYPKGSLMRCNDWRLDLTAARPADTPGRSRLRAPTS
jgi:RimJ/RimL family protein N-acetyltransferase